ncbi:hypothetical protein TI10_08805 [Photorhabdus luminescens subsp. luminescens]|uniref:Uncharacterized protein n=1 Tax=Photorhabdus luminescens TaxID=29488 RepID=A0A1G5REJ4_PHOLU|nr:hypothetical protein TI10_08805 [Photorhabdus luminescens subsp. luminescens]SCZ72485.1 hypothetical protein SAMN02982990_04039 [Photorhabdus luminescens]
MWIKSLLNILIIIILFIFSNIGFISIDLTIKEVITLWTNKEYTPSELSFFIQITDYAMLANNFLFVLCATIFFFRNKFKYSLRMIFSVLLITLINNISTLIYVLNFSSFFKLIKNHDIHLILVSFPVSMVIIYILARIKNK